MGSEFDRGPADGQNLTVPYLTELGRPEPRPKFDVYYPPLGPSVCAFTVFNLKTSIAVSVR